MRYLSPAPADAASVRSALAGGDGEQINAALLGAVYSIEDWRTVESLSIEAANQLPENVHVQFRYLQNVFLLVSMCRVPAAELDISSFGRLAAAALDRPALDRAEEVQDALDCFTELGSCAAVLETPLRRHVLEVKFSVVDASPDPVDDESEHLWSDDDQRAFEAEVRARLLTFEKVALRMGLRSHDRGAFFLDVGCAFRSIQHIASTLCGLEPIAMRHGLEVADVTLNVRRQG